MTEEQFARLQVMREKAERVPVCGIEDHMGGWKRLVGVNEDDEPLRNLGGGGALFRPSEAEFISEARGDILFLVDEVERLTLALALAEQVSGVLCDDCGWAMKFPDEPCRCEVVRQRDKAFRRGAEAMREAAALAVHEGFTTGLLTPAAVTRAVRVIRRLPIPEDKQ